LWYAPFTTAFPPVGVETTCAMREMIGFGCESFSAGGV
jgi:hypothetical protein